MEGEEKGRAITQFIRKKKKEISEKSVVRRRLKRQSSQGGEFLLPSEKKEGVGGLIIKATKGE